ncbi:hypothetical protein EVG20_g10728 [Dentipellis fragilis]|uniref:Uncharacterized protein n=1 Tax=Dentipellis fragilis TaxID=205917 RepID=A0A4Y9XRN0_9AGAM|nr:hypothetical protein EVG20_g10728 [Dentipellis fragilis]
MNQNSTEPDGCPDSLEADEHDFDEADEGLEGLESSEPDGKTLETTLQEAQSLTWLSDGVETQLNECGFAATSLELSSLEMIEKLPDDNPAILEEIRSLLAMALSTITATSASGAQQVQRLILEAGEHQETASVLDSTADGFDGAEVMTTDLSSLVAICRKHEMKEAKDAVANKLYTSAINDDSGKPANSTEDKQLTDRQLLTRRIYDIVRTDSERGSNHQNCWIKPAVGGTSQDAALASTEAGNTANAQLAACGTATAKVKLRRAAFMKEKINLSDDLTYAKVDMISVLKNSCWGIVCVDWRLMLAQVLTMYEKGGGKAGKHGWVSYSTSIGAVSYIVAQVWQHAGNRRRQFMTYHGKTKELCLLRYAHFPAFSFLYLLPHHSITSPPMNNNTFVEMSGPMFDKVYSKMLAEKGAIMRAVHALLHPPKTRKTKSND